MEYLVKIGNVRIAPITLIYATGAWDGPIWRKPGRKLLNQWETNPDPPQGTQGPPKGPPEGKRPGQTKGGKGGEYKEKEGKRGKGDEGLNEDKSLPPPGRKN